MHVIEALHAARLAHLEGALCALLRAAATNEQPNDQPDGISAHLTSEGVDLTYWRNGTAVAGEGF